jgi:hypothetical protein
MTRNRSVGLLIVILIIGALGATVFSEVLAQFLDPTNVVYRVLLHGYEYHVGPATISLIMATFTGGFSIDVNLLTVLILLAAFYYWKQRT